MLMGANRKIIRHANVQSAVATACHDVDRVTFTGLHHVFRRLDSRLRGNDRGETNPPACDYSSLSALRKAGKIPAESRVTRMAPQPPKIAEPTGPSKRAMPPDSNSPNSLDAPMKRLDTAETRPRMGSGVTICTSVWRTNTETMSAAPRIASAATLRTIERDQANTNVENP